MKKSRMLLTAGLIAASSAIAQAQPAPQSAPGRTTPPPRFNAEDFSAFTDARIASLKAGLKLTAEQERLWPAFEAALRERAKTRSDRWNERRAEWAARTSAQTGDQQRPPVDPIAQLRRSADASAERAAELRKIADAAEPLVKSLDDNQKRRFNALARLNAGEFRGGWRRGR